jgi:hypothetical protein
MTDSYELTYARTSDGRKRAQAHGVRFGQGLIKLVRQIPKTMRRRTQARQSQFFHLKKT